MSKPTDRTSFVFYKSFYDSIKDLPKENQIEVYNLIFEYCFFGKEPNFKNTSTAIFKLIKPNIDANNKRYFANIKNGKKGGRPSKTKTQSKPNQNPIKTQSNPNKTFNVDVDVDVDVDVEKRNNNNMSIQFEIEQIWKEYPRKEGKAIAFKKIPRILKEITKEQLLQAIRNYKLDIQTKKIEQKYIKMGSTFFNGGYMDYLDGDYQARKKMLEEKELDDAVKAALI